MRTQNSVDEIYIGALAMPTGAANPDGCQADADIHPAQPW